MSPELTAALWAIIHGSFESSIYSDRTGYGSYYLIDPWKTTLEVWYVRFEHGLVDEFSTDIRERRDHLKRIITSKDYLIVFEFIQFLIQRPECPHGLARSIDTVLTNCRSAYRILDKMVVPISSDANAEAVTKALQVAARATARGPAAHLKSAARALSAGQWSASTRESITAVEAAALSLEPSGKTLGDALKVLRKKGEKHPSLLLAFEKLYGYTNDEDGVRHAMVFDDDAKVTEADAMFMFGACASFVGYLLSASVEGRQGG